jgi:lipoyl(octanoyl) transferase
MSAEPTICGVVDWGREPYGRVYDWQRELVAARKAGRVPDLLLLGEHTPVITLGRNARRENIRLPEAELARRGVEIHETDRGGDVTYHGPGQLVGYPILDLAGLRKDLVWYVRALEEVLIRAAGEFGIEATRRVAPANKRQLYTGVWAGDEKLAAIGVHVSRWVTSHGFAFNVTTDLSHFDLIVPCGIGDKGVTSLEKVLGPSGGGRWAEQKRAQQHNRSAHGLLPVGVGPSSGGRWAEQEWAPAEKQVPPPHLAGAAAAYVESLNARGHKVRGRDDRTAEGLMAAVKAAVVKHFGEVFGREMISLSREELEERLGAQQAAAS